MDGKTQSPSFTAKVISKYVSTLSSSFWMDTSTDVLSVCVGNISAEKHHRLNPQYDADVDDRLNVGEIVGDRLGARLDLRIGRGFLRTAEGDAEGWKSDDGELDVCDDGT